MTPKPQLGDRTLFPTLRARAYTNHAAISPPSSAVSHTAAEVVADYAQHGVDAFMRWGERRDATRALIARLIGGDAAGVVFAANTTRALTDIALCVPWQTGDRVVLTTGEFPANVTPWQRAANLHGLEIVWLPQPHAEHIDTWLDALEAALERGARLVALSAVQFQTGLRMPLERVGALCAKYGAELAVDAIQACGVVPVDVAKCNIHYLAAGSHKWLMGLEGIALLYVDPPCAARLRPHVAGWLSHDDALSFLFEGPGHLRHDRGFQTSARVLEGGMYNTIGCAALSASLSLIMDLGVDAIFDHVDRYTSALADQLTPLGFVSQRASDVTLRSGVASFAVPDGVDIQKLHRAIDTSVVSCATPDGLLRFSPHWPNALAEVELVAAEVHRAVAAS